MKLNQFGSLGKLLRHGVSNLHDDGWCDHWSSTTMVQY